MPDGLPEENDFHPRRQRPLRQTLGPRAWLSDEQVILRVSKSEVPAMGIDSLSSRIRCLPWRQARDAEFTEIRP